MAGKTSVESLPYYGNFCTNFKVKKLSINTRCKPEPPLASNANCKRHFQAQHMKSESLSTVLGEGLPPRTVPQPRRSFWSMFSKKKSVQKEVNALPGL